MDVGDDDGVVIDDVDDFVVDIVDVGKLNSTNSLGVSMPVLAVVRAVPGCMAGCRGTGWGSGTGYGYPGSGTGYWVRVVGTGYRYGTLARVPQARVPGHARMCTGWLLGAAVVATRP